MGNGVLCFVYIVLRHTYLWGKTVPMHVGQDGPHACGARRFLCLIHPQAAVMVTMYQLYYT